MELNYFKTLIAVADDCPVAHSEVPAPRPRDAQPTVASLQYQMLAEHPRTYTQEDVLFQTWLDRQELPKKPAAAELRRMREEFFAKPQACLRASPLPKKYGWGLLFDDEGRITLTPMESKEYQRIANGEVAGIKVVKAMRSKRA